MIHKFSRYLLTLVALLAMTTGAWADEELTETIITTGYSGSNLTVNGTYFKVSGTQFRSDGGYNGVRIANGKTATISLIDPNSSAKATKIVLYPNGGDTDVQYAKIDGAGTYSSTDVTVSKDVSITNDGSATISWGGNVNYGVSISKIEIIYTAGPEVTISDDRTSAEFDMPSYDATLEYDIVRNMASNMTVSIGDGQDGYRIRVKKDGESFVPAEMTLQQMMALYTVHDATEQKDLLFYGDGKVCDISIFAVDDQGQPTGQAIAFTALTPGRYVAIATAPDDSPLYAGQTPQSNIFVLYQGYEVTVPAGEYITYYRDEALTLDTDETQAELYTITAVSETTATATPFDVIPANVPLLLKNNATETRSILLIPTETTDVVNFYDGFKGTLTGETVASGDDTDAYAFNGKEFVWVSTAGIDVAANKAWLEIQKANNSRSLTLVFGDTTGIDAMVNGQWSMDTWYDLNGRKLNGMPTKKGVYIMNGKKVVIK